MHFNPALLADLDRYCQFLAHTRGTVQCPELPEYPAGKAPVEYAVLASRVPGGCGASPQCCTAFCDLQDGDAPCQDIDPELTCVDWMSPDPTWSDVGVCATPS